MGDVLLDIRGVSVDYRRHAANWRRARPFRALDDVSCSVVRGEAFGLVGESGAGKSTLARCVAGLRRPTTGTILFAGQPFDPARDRGQRRAVQMVFQDPLSSLNPARSIGGVFVELLRAHGLAASRTAARARAAELLEQVGLSASAMERRPSAFSGGQRQRIGIARALALRPALLVADEPVSALDVSIQASILILLKRLQEDLGLTVLLVSHDLAVVHQFCDRVAVMRDGRVVETSPVAELFSAPKVAYTRELLAATPALPRLETTLASP